MISNIASERTCVEKNRFNLAERKFHEMANKHQKDIESVLNVRQLNGNTTINNIPINVSTNIKNNNKSGDLLDSMSTQKKATNKKGKKSLAFVEEDPANEPFNEVIAKNTGEVVHEILPPNQGNMKNKKKNQNKQAKQQQQQQLQEIKMCVQAADKVATNQTNVATMTLNKSKNKVAKPKGTCTNTQSTLVSEIAKAREHIKNSLEKMDGIATLASSSISGEVLDRIGALEKNNDELRKLVESLRSLNLESEKRITALESRLGGASSIPATVAITKQIVVQPEDNDDDVDLFGSDDETEDTEAAALREKRLAAYAEKKSKKPALIAKSSLVLDVKPWGDDTDLKVMETEIRKITSDGLLWGASKFAPVAFGIQKLTISCVVEDDKISIDWLTEEIEKIEDYVQSVDVAAFNKI